MSWFPTILTDSKSNTRELNYPKVKNDTEAKKVYNIVSVVDHNHNGVPLKVKNKRIKNRSKLTNPNLTQIFFKFGLIVRVMNFYFNLV